MARFSLAAFQLRCLGTVGGCLGMVVGAFVGLIVAAGVTHNAFATIPGLFIGAAIGTAVGIFVSLKLMAR